MGGLNAKNIGSVDYELMEKARTAQLQNEMRDRLKNEFGDRTDGLRRRVLSFVVSGNYDKAIEAVDNFLTFKEDFPDFRPRVSQMVQHGKELINAIKMKRNFPGMCHLTIAKQKEIMDHVVNHFNELKFTLKNIEKVAQEVALNDIRSTVWLIKTINYVVIAIVVSLFALGFNEEIGRPFWVVFSDFSRIIVDKLYSLIGL